MTNNTFKPADESPPARRIDGLDAALVGIARQSGVNVAVYDYGGCLTLLRLQGISEEAAPEHLARKLENDQGRAGAPVILYWPSRQAPQAPLPADRVLKLIPAADIAILTQALEMISGVAGRLDFRQQGLEFQQANMPTERGPTTIAELEALVRALDMARIAALIGMPDPLGYPVDNAVVVGGA